MYETFLTVGTDCNNDPFTSHFAIVRSYVELSLAKCLTLKPDLSSSEKMYPTKLKFQYNIIVEEDYASSDDISNVYHQV